IEEERTASATVFCRLDCVACFQHGSQTRARACLRGDCRVASLRATNAPALSILRLRATSAKPLCGDPSAVRHGAQAHATMTGHLIHIGYAKAGSTFLRSWFAQHPQLAYAPGGIAGFRDVYSMVEASASPGLQPLYRVTSAEAFATPVVGFGQDSLDYEAI